MIKLFPLCALLLAACAPTGPYVTEARVGELPRHWAVSEPGAGGVKAVTVHNPHAHPHFLVVECLGDVGDGTSRFGVDVAAGGEHRRLITVQQRYLVGSACYLLSSVLDASAGWP